MKHLLLFLLLTLSAQATPRSEDVPVISLGILVQGHGYWFFVPLTTIPPSAQTVIVNDATYRSKKGGLTVTF